MALIEIMTFRLAPGVDDDVFIAADAVVQSDFSYRQRGVVRRTVARSDDGTWLLHTIWATTDDAQAAADAFTASDLGADFMSMMDEATITVSTFTPAGAA